jgi:phage-related minor tail protein
VDDEDFTRYNSVLETTRTKLAQVMEAETAEGRARIEQAQAAQRAAASGKTFIASLEEQTAAIGKTRAEILELKAAQLGVTQQAAPMIAKLKEQENVWRNGAISGGQYRNAMRYLPMQMTDMATSLASGMPVYLVAIQQGGQLRDTFGGVGNALKAILSLVTPAKLALGGMIGVAGLLACWSLPGIKVHKRYPNITNS